MTDKLNITIELEGSSIKGYEVTCTGPSKLEKKQNGIEPYYELEISTAKKLRIETYFGDLSGDTEIKGGNNWSFPFLGVLLTDLYEAEKVPLKQTVKLSRIKRWIKRSRPFDLNSEWVE